MKPAIIFSSPATSAHGYTWSWRAAHAQVESTTQFEYYYECLSDAQGNGYTVEVSLAQGNTAPGWRSLTAPVSLASHV